MELSVALKHLRQSKKPTFFNHNNNRVSYSLESKHHVTSMTNLSRVSSQPRYAKMCKSLRKIKEKERDRESLSVKMEERMKIKRAMELEKLFEENTRMFARIYTQKSEYRNDKLSVLVKKRKMGNRSMKENQTPSFLKGNEILEESKIMRMRQRCSFPKTTVLPYVRDK